MELLNSVAKLDSSDDQSRAVRGEALSTSVLLLAPVAPHICHTLWHRLGHPEAVANTAWPEVDVLALEQSSVQLMVQVNGKVRGKIEVAVDADREHIERLALAEDNTQRFIAELTVRKMIVVPGKLVNIVAN
jgi:leucyl-tRNA synthetase